MSKLTASFRLTVGAGKASPQPPVGSALGQRGLNLMNFCKAFNDQTAQYIVGTPMQVQVRAFADRTFEFDVKTPRTSYFLKKAAGLEKGATTPGTQIAGRLSLKDIYEIAKVKYTDPQISRSMTLEGICRSIAAQCKSMGIVVYDPRQEKSS